MIMDTNLLFTGTANGGSGGISAGPYVDSPTVGTQDCTNTIDLGINNGSPSSANGGGARDIGIGDDPSLKVFAVVTAAFTAGTSLALELSGAPDNGFGAPGTYVVLWASPAFPEALLVQGARVANIDVPRNLPGIGLVRYMKMTAVSVGTHTAGSLEAAIVLDRADDIKGPTGASSGYPAGVAVPN